MSFPVKFRKTNLHINSLLFSFYFYEKLGLGAAYLKNVHSKLGLSFKANLFKAILKAPFQLCRKYVINNKKP